MIGQIGSILIKVGTFLSGIFFTVAHPDITSSFLSLADMVKNSAMGAVEYLGGIA